MMASEVMRAMRRRWWLVLGMPLTVLLVTIARGDRTPEVVQARLSFALDVPPELVIPTSDAHAAKVGETLIDDISRVIGGDVFASRIEARLGGAGVAAGELASTLSATDRHRVVDVTVTRLLEPGASAQALAQTGADLEAISLAVVSELEENGSAWFALLGASGASLALVDEPDALVLPASWRQRLELPLRILASLALGAALALALWVVDPRILTPDQAVAAAAAPLLGAVEACPGQSSAARIAPRP